MVTVKVSQSTEFLEQVELYSGDSLEATGHSVMMWEEIFQALLRFPRTKSS